MCIKNLETHIYITHAYLFTVTSINRMSTHTKSGIHWIHTCLYRLIDCISNQKQTFILTLILLALPSSIIQRKNFHFNLRRDHQKISYERRAYESADEKSLFWLVPKNDEKKNNSGGIS